MENQVTTDTAIMPAILTTREVCAYLRISNTALMTRIIAEGKLPFIRVGSVYRFRRADVETFAAGGVMGE